jgi:hypothetical protein
VVGTWLTINSGTGEVKVDTDVADEETVYVRINYAGANQQTNSFRVKVTCTSLTISTSVLDFVYVIPTIVPGTSIKAKDGIDYMTGTPSHGTGCPY